MSNYALPYWGYFDRSCPIEWSLLSLQSFLSMIKTFKFMYKTKYLTLYTYSGPFITVSVENNL